MSNEIPWIREKLLEKYPDLDQDGGVDLDGRHGIRGNEIADTNGDHFVDDSEARDFYVANQRILNRRIPYFKWSSVLSPDNPVHELIYLESKFLPATMVQGAYEFLGRVLAETNRLLEEKEQDGELDPYWKMMQIYLALTPSVTIETQYSLLRNIFFLSNISDRSMDCNTSTYVLFAVAHEKVWPVYAVHAPFHTFARWDDGNGETYNFDILNEGGKTDEYYIRQYHIDPVSVESGAYMVNLTASELRGAFFADVGESLLGMRKFEDALEYCDRAIELDGENVNAYGNRAKAYWNLNRLEEANAGFGRVIELDPQMDKAYFFRARIRLQLGQYEEALSDLDRALSRSPDDCVAHYLRGVAYRELGRAIDAEADFATAIGICPQLATAVDYSVEDAARLGQSENERRCDEFISRGENRRSRSDFEGAFDDYTHALELDPANILARLGLGIVKVEMGHFEEGIADFTAVIESYPSYALSYLKRGQAYVGLGRYDEALRDIEKVLELDPDNEQARQQRERLMTMMGGQQ